MIIDHFYSATLSTTTQMHSQLQHRYFIGVSRQSAQATVSEGLAQGPYVAARVAEFDVFYSAFSNLDRKMDSHL